MHHTFSFSTKSIPCCFESMLNVEARRCRASMNKINLTYILDGHLDICATSFQHSTFTVKFIILRHVSDLQAMAIVNSQVVPPLPLLAGFW